MTLRTFGPGFVVDHATMRGVPSVAAIVTDPVSGEVVPTFGMDGVAPATVITNRFGYFNQFRADPASGWVRLKFGSITLDVDPVGGSVSQDPAFASGLKVRLARSRDYGAARITCIGDSETAGVGATVQNSWPSQLLRMLESDGYPVTGTGVIHPYNGASDSRWSKTGTVVDNGLASTLASGATIQFVDDRPCDTIQLYYANNGGAFNYQIDGGALVGVVPSGADNIGTTNLFPAGGGPHTVKIIATAANCKIYGFNMTSVFPALQVHNSGMSYSASNWWYPNYYTPQSLYWQGFVQPTDMTIVMLGVNDASSGRSAADYQSDLDALVSDIKLYRGPVLVVSQPQPDTVSPAVWAQFQEAARTVAAANECPYLDITERWGDYASANALGLMADGTHPNKKGYGDIASAIYDIIATGTGGASSGGVTDHGALTGLGDDDHTQYHNNARGDARYSLLAHTHTAANVTDFAETVRDTMGTALVAGTGITITPNDGADTITIAATGETADYCRVQLSANQSVATSTVASVLWATEVADAGGFHSTSSNTDRITVPSGKGGVYMVACTLGYAASATNGRSLIIRKNGVAGSVLDFGQQANQKAGDPTMITMSVPVRLAVGDYLTFLAFQDSGGPLDLLSDRCFASVVRVGA